MCLGGFFHSLVETFLCMSLVVIYRFLAVNIAHLAHSMVLLREGVTLPAHVTEPVLRKQLEKVRHRRLS